MNIGIDNQGENTEKKEERNLGAYALIRSLEVRSILGGRKLGTSLGVGKNEVFLFNRGVKDPNSNLITYVILTSKGYRSFRLRDIGEKGELDSRKYEECVNKVIEYKSKDPVKDSERDLGYLGNGISPEGKLRNLGYSEEEVQKYKDLVISNNPESKMHTFPMLDRFTYEVRGLHDDKYGEYLHISDNLNPSSNIAIKLESYVPKEAIDEAFKGKELDIANVSDV